MPFRNAWRKTLAKEKGSALANCLIKKAQANYAALYSSRKTLSTRTLQIHLERFLLPALGMYQALRAEGDGREAALETVEDLFSMELKPLKKGIELVGRTPFLFRAVRASIRFAMKLIFPPKGWEAEWLEVSSKTVAFNIHGCVYFETLNAYGAPELTTVFCALDNFVFDDVSPFIDWERTQTIGRGGAYCDFRFYPGKEQ